MGTLNKKLIAIALLAVLSMSLVPLLIRSTQANEVTIGIARIFIAFALLTPVVMGLGFLKAISPRAWLQLMAVGLVFGIHWFTYFTSIKMAGAAIGALSVSTYGIHLLILNWLIKKHAVRPVEWLAIFACCIGCVLIAPSLDLANKVTLGMLVGICSGFFYACLPLLHQQITQVPTMARAWGQFTFAGLVFFPLWPLSDWQLNSQDWWCLIVLGVVCTVIGHSLWVKSSTELPPVITGVAYYLYIPIAMLSGFMFLDEAVSWSMLAGAVLILSANISTAILAWRRTKIAKFSEAV